MNTCPCMDCQKIRDIEFVNYFVDEFRRFKFARK